MKFSGRQNIILLATLGIEGCWLYAIMALLNDKVAGGLLSTIWLFSLYPISCIFNRALLRLRLPEIAVRYINIVVWAVAALLMVKFQLFSQMSLSDTAWLNSIGEAFTRILHAFRPELLILASSALLWWLGRRMSYLKTTFTISVAEFQFGLVILALFLFASAQLGTGLGHALPVSLAFFLFSLVSMAVSHAQDGAWLWGLQRGHWSGLLILSIILVIALGFVISAIVTPDFIQLILDAIKWVWRLITKVLEYLASLLPEPGPVEPLPDMEMMPAGEPETPGPWFSIPEIIRNGLQLGWAILFGGMIIFAMWRVLSHVFGRLRRPSKGYETESLRGALKEDLLNLLRRILRLLGGIRLWSGLKKRTSSIPPEIASVREIYRQVLRWAAAGGYPRGLSQTPYEYLGILQNLVPEAVTDLDLITQHYVNTRYGLYKPAESDLHQLKQSWHNIKSHHLKRQDSRK